MFDKLMRDLSKGCGPTLGQQDVTVVECQPGWLLRADPLPQQLHAHMHVQQVTCSSAAETHE
jgi:hypothetical protein